MSLQTFIYLFRSKNTIEAVLAKDVKKYGISLSEFGVLEYLFHKGETPILIVCEKLLVQNSAMTYIASKLDEKGLIVRKKDEEDMRRMMLSLTLKGTELMKIIFPKYEALINRFFETLTSTELEILDQSLKKIGLKAKEYLK